MMKLKFTPVFTLIAFLCISFTMNAQEMARSVKTQKTQKIDAKNTAENDTYMSKQLFQELDLTEAQEEKIAEIMRKRRELSTQKNTDKSTKYINSRKEIEEVLTPEQLKKWNAIEADRKNGLLQSRDGESTK